MKYSKYMYIVRAGGAIIVASVISTNLGISPIQSGFLACGLFWLSS